MRYPLNTLIISIATLAVGLTESAAQTAGAATNYPVDSQMVARIREEGLQRSQLANTLSYMTDVLGARLTNSRDMERAQRWAMKNTVRHEKLRRSAFVRLSMPSSVPSKLINAIPCLC